MTLPVRVVPDPNTQGALDDIAQAFPLGPEHLRVLPRARVYHDANQATTTATTLYLAFNQERYDTDAIHSTSSNNSRLTCVTPGTYSIKANVEYDDNATGIRVVDLWLNRADVIASSLEQATTTTLGNRITVACDYELVVGDYVEVGAFQNSGGGLNVLTAAKYSPEFSMHWISP